MRLIAAAVFTMLLIDARLVSGQSVLVQGSFGPTLLDSGHNLSYGFDPGHSLAAGIGLGLTPKLALLVEVDRTHRASQLQTDARGNTFGFRGGSLTLATGALRASLFRPERIGPYGLLGFSAGVSRPRRTSQYPRRITNDVRAMTFGGGIHIPLRDRFSLFADGRMTIGAEAGELLAVAPFRAGASWRF